jgi:glycosyltransferase involved in cell wall biosynthesis
MIVKPRVVFLSAFATPFRSGAEACVEEVALALSDRYEMTIVTARLRRDLPIVDHIDERVDIRRVGLGLPIDKWLFPFLAPFAAKRFEPEIIHAVLESYAGLAMVFCKRIVPKAKRILTCQSTNTSFLLRWMHRSADVVTCISSVLIERAKKLGRSDAVLIPNGIDYAGIAAVARRHSKVKGRILFVGRLEKVKGADTLLASIPRPLPPQEEGGTRLHIVGSGSQRKNLEQLAQKLGVADHVRFLGYLSGLELMKEYAEAEIFCGLSRSEALGNVFLEAQAAGCAVVATNVGGIPEIVKDGEVGFLVPPDDPDAAGKKIEQLLTDHALRKTFSEAGMQHAKNYDWADIAAQYGQVYGSARLAAADVGGLRVG